MTNAAAINWNYCPWRSASVDIKGTFLIKGFSETGRDYHENENHDSHSYHCTTSLSWSWNCEVVVCIVILILILRSRIVPHLQDEDKWEKSILYCFLLLSFFIKACRVVGTSPLWCHEWPTYLANNTCLHTVRYFFCLHHLDDKSPSSIDQVRREQHLHTRHYLLLWWTKNSE